MEFRKQGDLWITNFGDELLQKHPDFVKSVWMNPERRRFLFEDKMGGKEFTEITGPDGTLYFEKTGEGGRDQLERYKVMELILTESDFNHLARIVRPYLATKNKILLEHIMPYGKGVLPKDQLFREEILASADISLRVDSIEFGRANDEFLVVYDPHV